MLALRCAEGNTMTKDCPESYREFVRKMRLKGKRKTLESLIVAIEQECEDISETFECVHLPRSELLSFFDVSSSE